MTPSSIIDERLAIFDFYENVITKVFIHIIYTELEENRDVVQNFDNE